MHEHLGSTFTPRQGELAFISMDTFLCVSPRHLSRQELIKPHSSLSEAPLRQLLCDIAIRRGMQP